MSWRIMITLMAFATWSGTMKATAQRRPKDRILDKKVFVIQLEPLSDKKRKDPEPIGLELSFRSNRIVSRYMQGPDGGGFQAGEYAIYDTDEILGEKRYRFEGINKNAKGESLKWMGTVYGDRIEGTATVSKKGRIKREYTFTGALKQKRKRN